MTSRLLTCAIVLSLSACGVSAGGGGGVPIIGGAPESPCDPTVFTQGCSGITKVTCDPGTSKWKSIGDCPAGQACVGMQDPAAPNTVKKIATCITPGATTDTGGATDTGGVADAGGQGDGATTGDAGVVTGDDGAVAKSDVGASQDGGGTTPTSGPWLKCVAEKCASQWGVCSAEATCKIAALCQDGCGDDKKCQQLCFDNTSGGAQDKLISVVMCATQTGCKAGPAGPKCGDGKCEAGETSGGCPQDCKATGPECGNGTCEDGESNATCPKDCEPTQALCGNGKCEQGETPQTCLADCKPICGDGKCEQGEVKSTCPQDCGPVTVCGNNVCEQGETASSCAKDCGPKPVCGDGKCESGETASTCPKDCSAGGTCLEQKCSAQYKVCTTNTKCLAIVYFAVLNSCASANNCKDSGCVSSKCGKESSSCQQDAGCYNVLVCLNKCTTESCQDGCFDKAAMTQYESLGKCSQANCPNG